MTDDARTLIDEMLRAFVRENALSRMDGPVGSGYFRCVLCDHVIQPQHGGERQPHRPRCLVPQFEQRARELADK